MLDVYEWVQDLQVEVSYRRLPQNKSVSAECDGHCYIGLDASLKNDSIQERTCIAHEAGHCQAGAFYNVYSPYDIRAKHEYKANRCAYEKCLPACDIQNAITDGYTEPWELADLFDFTQSFICGAIAYYTEQRGIKFNCKEE